MVNLAYSSVLEGLLKDIVQFYPELIAQLPSNLTLDTPDDINKLQGKRHRQQRMAIGQLHVSHCWKPPSDVLHCPKCRP
eukprot:scaffold1371_cov400-Prasinococcus_capsulatus_cf.AAC.3